MNGTTSAKDYPPGYLEADNSKQLYVATTICLTLCTLLLCLRLWARSLTRAERGWDDFFLIPSYVLFVGVCILMYVAIPRAGIGRHQVAVLAEDPHKIEIWNQISVVLLYLRIFTSRAARYFCWGVIIFLVGNCVAFLITLNLQCIPFEFTWNKEIEGRCFNVPLWWEISNIPNVVADIAILLLPIQTIFNLRAIMIKKLSLWFVCLTGSVGLVASCIRTAEFFDVYGAERHDPTWTSAELAVWSVVECSMYFCAACLVCLKPLYGRLPSLIRGHWTQTRQSRQPSNKAATVSPAPRFDGSWRNLGKGKGRDADSASHIVEVEFEEEEKVLPNPNACHVKENRAATTWDNIYINTTLEVASTVEEHSEEYRYTLA